ncbi:hypothetical protein LSAT2_004248 [Lamellibrachia satsuma]|nr:hypothetical protein LSAT2_004248 [Lamellibrachia satsuma]
MGWISPHSQVLGSLLGVGPHADAGYCAQSHVNHSPRCHERPLVSAPVVSESWDTNCNDRERARIVEFLRSKLGYTPGGVLAMNLINRARLYRLPPCWFYAHAHNYP